MTDAATQKVRPHKKGSGATKGPGRPAKLKADATTLGRLSALARIQCTQGEAASVLGINPKTLSRFLRREPEAADAWTQGRDAGRVDLRRTQFRLAQSSAAMSIWLGKQYLGQRDRVAITGADDGPIEQLHRIERVIVDPNRPAES